LGAVLVRNLRKRRNESFDSFYLAVAYVTESGARHLHDQILSFRKSGGTVRAIVGIGQGNSTREGLHALLNCANQVYVYHDANRRRTFHPKLYIFERRNHYAEVVVGSSNLTESGLFSNYELNMITRLDLRNPKQRKLFKDYNAAFEQFLATPECCKRLDAVLLAELDSRGMLGSERGRRVRPSSEGQHEVPIFGTARMKTHIPKIAAEKVPWRVPVLPKLKSNVFWKVAPGEHARQWPLWRREINSDGNGFVAIGWRFDLTTLPFDHPNLNAIVKRNLRRVGLGERKSGYVATQATRFCEEIEQDHIVVAYSNAQIYGIAEVTEQKAYHVKIVSEETEAYPTRKKVRWLVLPFTRPSKHVMKHLATRDTVHRIDDDETIKTIKQLLRKRR